MTTQRQWLTSSIALLSVLFSVPAASQDATDPVFPDQVLKHMAKGEQPEAAKLLLETISADPKNQAAWFLLGKAYNDLGAHGRAEKALLRSAKLGGGTADLRGEMGIALAGLGRYQEAMEHLENARPDDAEVAYARGIVAYRLGRVADAHKALAKAEQDPVLKNRAQRAREWIDTRRAERKKWHLQLTLGTSWNTNVTYLPHNAAIAPGDPDDREAPTATLVLRQASELGCIIAHIPPYCVTSQSYVTSWRNRYGEEVHRSSRGSRAECTPRRGEEAQGVIAKGAPSTGAAQGGR